MSEHCFTVTFSDQAWKVLNRNAAIRKESIAESIAHALAVHEWFIEQQLVGNRVLVEDRDSGKMREVGLTSGSD